MNSQVKKSFSPDDTMKIAEDFARTLRPGTVIALHGNLGAGKTTFIKGLAQGLGLKKGHEVTSPTFALMHIYPTNPPLYHFDLYRLDSPKEIADIGFEEHINDPKAITCVEWAEKGEVFFPSSAIHVFFEPLHENERQIRIESK